MESSLLQSFLASGLHLNSRCYANYDVKEYCTGLVDFSFLSATKIALPAKALSRLATECPRFGKSYSVLIVP